MESHLVNINAWEAIKMLATYTYGFTWGFIKLFAVTLWPAGWIMLGILFLFKLVFNRLLPNFFNKRKKTRREAERLGRQEEYEKLRKEIQQMPKYQEWREKVFKKEGKQCGICGKQTQLEIHHRTSLHSIIAQNNVANIYDALECNRLWDVNNGSVICNTCHEKMRSSRYRDNELKDLDGNSGL